MNAHKIIASGLSIGYIGKGSGTVAALACSIIWYSSGIGNFPLAALILTIVITLVGVWSSQQMENVWGHDSSRVVIDEIAGMCISLLWLPVNWKYTLAALVLFRFFDIVKPFYIRNLEKLNGGWGVMMDDVLAGIYSNILLQICVFLNLF